MIHTNSETMERWAVRKRLRQLYRVLLDSRVALEWASEAVHDKWTKDLLFILACRKVIMMNLLDRELGTLPIRLEPGPDASHRFDPYLPAMENDAKPERDLLQVCQEEESYLLHELRCLAYEAGVGGRTRQILAELVREVEENLNDLRFLSGDRRSARA